MRSGMIGVGSKPPWVPQRICRGRFNTPGLIKGTRRNKVPISLRETMVPSVKHFKEMALQSTAKGPFRPRAERVTEKEWLPAIAGRDLTHLLSFLATFAQGHL